MFTQLNPSLPVQVLDRGRGQAVGIIDYGPEHHLIWVTALDENGEIWCAPNPQVRFQNNWTMGRRTAHSATSVAQACTCHNDHAIAGASPC
ncbi:hypothetical protein GCM10009127_12060 [Alteraurantiacibacter aestuarii]|uniref:Uncharacterized protein n=2 Tax=Alteraurantiacibacter aestuarii TaxID=650004 RepID=A0A844ZGF0_9SPHN|nr:hypothetical protein [Alteraurantiacibacter aestuarii]MXO87591.1 hypothetical protein [Alteraurantiacibacter aestuarii]